LDHWQASSGFVKEEGPLYQGGTWTIQLTSPLLAGFTSLWLLELQVTGPTPGGRLLFPNRIV
jgi:hypothetical protein